MIYLGKVWHRRVGPRLGALSLLCLAAACAAEGVSPTSDAPAIGGPADSLAVAAPTDSTLAVPADSVVMVDTLTAAALTTPGIFFGAAGMQSKYFNSLYRASKQGLLPKFTMSELALARAKGGRMVLMMASKDDSRKQNADGTFSFTKWKALVDEFRPLALNSYIADGTLIGHFLIDEPENAKKWGGKPIPQATVEAMAKYSKQIWPGLTTFARVPPTWLAKSSITYVYLDAGWAQYDAWRGSAIQWATTEAAAARSKRLGLVVGLNVLDGGNGSSKIRGWLPYRWSMTAAEIRSYGAAMLSPTVACGFLSWTYLYQGAAYFARSDINSAMVELSNKAKAHAAASCRQ